MSDHHDGIEENDNHLPNWWLATLFGAMIFSVVYWAYYHTLSVGALQAAELSADQTALREVREKNAPKMGDEQLLALVKDQAAVGRGRDVFAANCVACHAAKGEGSVGPNLTDEFWIHGGKPMQILDVVTKGVTDKGMLAWGPILGAEKVRDVTVFVLSIKNTNVAGKAPQGEKEQ